MKPVSATLLIVSLLLTSSLLRTTAAQADTSYPCNSKCQDRCALAGEKKRCLDYCGICCQICKCVPPGTSGNKSECPCYGGLRNSKDTSKCP
ncbi:peamaclein-like [Rhododendron vialii]|uniref:peamaclein-like n=1 Tax=Rhododendron vialii TaxID=182163 RepID=UPI00265DC61E|nr:peamaclein-like [Rhododendron vialii]